MKRFSLRTFLLLVSVIALIFGGIGFLARPFDPQVTFENLSAEVLPQTKANAKLRIRIRATVRNNGNKSLSFSGPCLTVSGRYLDQASGTFVFSTEKTFFRKQDTTSIFPGSVVRLDDTVEMGRADLQQLEAHVTIRFTDWSNRIGDSRSLKVRVDEPSDAPKDGLRNYTNGMSAVPAR